MKYIPTFEGFVIESVHTIRARVIDDFAPSDKYPQWGYSIDFVDIDDNKYFVEYPNSKGNRFEFKKGESYEFKANVEEKKSLLNSTYRRLSRIKDIKKIDNL